MSKASRGDVVAVYDPRIDPKYKARNLYWQGWKISAIAGELGLPAPTIHSWKRRENWDGGTPVQRVQASVEARLIQLTAMHNKSDGNYKEIDKLYNLLHPPVGRQRRQDVEPVGTRMPDIPTIDNPPREPKSRGVIIKNEKPKQNYFDPEQIKRMEEIFKEQLFAYQIEWLMAGKKFRRRNIVKSRQIGATYFFAIEAFIKALKTGKNQIFLSASRAQAFQFKQYQIDFAAMVDVDLRGDTILLPNSGAKLYYLGTNSRTAQGRHGDLYVDEYFWIQDFKNLRRLANPMASQKHYTTTYFSTPSFESHPAHSYWSGALFNEKRPSSEHINLDVSHQALKCGRLDADGQWRQIVTLDDAEAKGCNLFDRDDLLLEYSPEEFRQLFLCEFAKDGDSVFDYQLLMSAGVDGFSEWAHVYKFYTLRPAGNHPVWVSYDPTDKGDAAGLVVAIAPQHDGDPFRIIEKRLLRGNDFQEQADAIHALLSQYNVTKIVMDTTGIGAAVFQLVQRFFPMVIGMKYTVELKTLMVHKALSLFRSNRVQWDGVDHDLLLSFMGIRQQATAGGHTLTFASERSETASHCDLAWAAMMLFFQEPIYGHSDGSSSFDVF